MTDPTPDPWASEPPLDLYDESPYTAWRTALAAVRPLYDQMRAERDEARDDANRLAAYLRNVPGDRPDRDDIIAAHDALVARQGSAMSYTDACPDGDDCSYPECGWPECRLHPSPEEDQP
jgi:hypothetical protein